MSDSQTINLSKTPARPSVVEMDEAMVWVSEALGQKWGCTRLGALYVFVVADGSRHQSRRRDFRVAVAEVTGLTVTR